MEETASLLCELLKQTKVAVISGASFKQFESELLKPLTATVRELTNLYILTTSGAELWVYRGGWQRIYAEKLASRDKVRVRRAFRQILAISEKELEPLLDDRDSGMTYSALGKDTPADLKHLWDPDQKKRTILVEKLSPLLSGLELKIGGTTSIDVTNDGIDKAFGLRKIIEYTKLPRDSVVFVGDALFPEGNDNPVKNVGIKVMETRGPENTQKIMGDFLQAPKTIEASSIKYDQREPVAFISAEYALDDDSLTYAGGLGVLAADFLYEANDRALPMVFVGLWYSHKNKDIKQNKYSLITINGKPLVIEIPFENKAIKARAYARNFGQNTWLILLDTDIEENDEESRKILSTIYAMDDYTWVRQDLVLGVGSARMLQTLHISPHLYHLNEGHTAFTTLELIARSASSFKDKNILKAVKEIRKKIVATKHTIFSQAGVKIEESDFMRYFGPYFHSLGVSAEELFSLGVDPEVRVFSATHFLLNTAIRRNAVSILHAKFEKKVHPKSRLISITNGVYRDRWFGREWGNDRQKLTDEKIWQVKSKLRKELIDYTNAKTGSTLDQNTCTVVWARRFVAYKRPELLISDIERLEKICFGIHSLQLIISGNVYNNDVSAKNALDRIRTLTNNPKWKNKIAYIPDYSISLAHKLVAGADIWLNTPFRGKEACGTSGMKAGLNGTLQMSISDGWIEEVKWKNIGWILPEENTASAMYNFLEKEVTPLFYKRENNTPHQWIRRMKKTMSMVEKKFTTKRMLDDYIKKLYKL